MANRSLQSKVIKELYARSGNMCAFPGCFCKLFFNGMNISEICHIQGLNPNSARHNSSLSDTEVNSIENLILLCPTHHSLVDQKPSKYTVECLKEMKATHEEWVAQRLHNGNNIQEAFYTELRKIFQESQFDMIFLEQNFCTPFQDWFFESVEMGYAKIRDLLNSECALSISSHIKKIYIHLHNWLSIPLQGWQWDAFQMEPVMQYRVTINKMKKLSVNTWSKSGRYM